MTYLIYLEILKEWGCPGGVWESVMAQAGELRVQLKSSLIREFMWEPLHKGEFPLCNPLVWMDKKRCKVRRE